MASMNSKEKKPRIYANTPAGLSMASEALRVCAEVKEKLKKFGPFSIALDSITLASGDTAELAVEHETPPPPRPQNQEISVGSVWYAPRISSEPFVVRDEAHRQLLQTAIPLVAPGTCYDLGDDDPGA